MEITARIGDRIPGEEERYYMTVDGDDRLFAISRGQADDLDPSPDILHPVKQPEVFAVLLDRITIAGADGNVTAEWQLQGSITDQDASTNWTITVPVRYPADDASIKTLKSCAEDLNLGNYVEEATEENLEKRGLLHPAYTLTLHMAAGSTGKVSDSGVYDVADRPENTVVIDIALFVLLLVFCSAALNAKAASPFTALHTDLLRNAFFQLFHMGDDAHQSLPFGEPAQHFQSLIQHAAAE
jgi:hypothetical protein